jgi:hypothetical protein
MIFLRSQQGMRREQLTLVMHRGVCSHAQTLFLVVLPRSGPPFNSSLDVNCIGMFLSNLPKMHGRHQ